MIRQELNGLNWLAFDILASAGVTHGVFLRRGGAGKSPFDSLNVSSMVGDDETHVTENIHRIQQALGVSSLASLHQVHGNGVVTVSNPAQCSPGTQGDALITDVPGVPIMVRHADCQAAIFYDPIRKAIAAAHAGWRGSVLDIYGTVIDRLRALGSQPSNLLVGISPSLGPCHAEFVNYRHELPESFWPYQVKPTYFDFWAIATDQLKAHGVLPHHIEVARLCTYANRDDCFSARRDKITGRHGTVIAL